MCVPTAYAIDRGVWTGGVKVGGKATCSWWLRSPGETSSNAACTFVDGGVKSRGDDVNKNNLGVRPAFWIKPGSQIFL